MCVRRTDKKGARRIETYVEWPVLGDVAGGVNITAPRQSGSVGMNIQRLATANRKLRKKSVMKQVGGLGFAAGGWKGHRGRKKRTKLEKKTRTRETMLWGEEPEY